MNKIAALVFPALACGLLFSPAARAQDLSAMVQQNMMFDQQQNAQLQAMMMQNQMAQQQLMQNYVQQYGQQRLWAEYQQYVQYTGMQIPFDQFVYYHMATQGGRNAGPAIQQQQANFQALQRANQTQQLALVHIERHLADGGQPAKAHADVFNLEQGVFANGGVSGVHACLPGSSPAPYRPGRAAKNASLRTAAHRTPAACSHR